MLNKKKTLMIIDGFAIIFRAYYALIRSSSLTTSLGEPTGAIFGFIKMIIEALIRNQPDYVVVAWDSKEKTFREELYKDYKANREEAPEDLLVQIPHIIQSMNSFNISSLVKEGYEADDVIGTICEKFRYRDDLDIIVLSGDKDLLQLVGDNIKVMANRKGVSEFIIYDKNKVKEKWGVYPEKIVDLFAFIGDSSDNIPGVKGIGEKSAVSLLTQFESLDEVFDNITSIKSKRIKTHLTKEDSKKMALLSRELFIIKRDLELNIDLDDFEEYDFTSKEAQEIYDKFELRTIKNKELPKKIGENVELIKLDNPSINNKKTKEIKTSKTSDIQQSLFDINPPISDDDKGTNKNNLNYKHINKKDELGNIYKELQNVKYISFDFETTSEDAIKAEAIGFSISWTEKEAYYISIKHNVEKDFDYEYILDFLKKLFNDKNIYIIGQNLKYEYMILKNMGIEPVNFYFDTMLAAYVLDPDYSPFNMDKLAERLLSYKTTKYNEIVDKNQTLLDIDFNRVVNYACEDADITYRLFNVLKPEIDNSKMKSLFYDIEMPLIKVLGDMELVGVSIDSDYFHKMSIELEKEMKQIEEKIYELNDGEHFNLNSPKQLQEILFDKLGLTSTKKTGKGARSTDVQVLEKLSTEHEIPRLILEYRTLSKLKNSYLDTIPNMVNNKTKRIHASFNQAIVATGRLSSNNPNMQNIPIKGELGKKIRRGFIATKGTYLLSADYSQIELRLLAHFSEEPKLIEAYNKNKDLHKQTASLLFDKPEDKITIDERTKGKTLNFSIFYGIGPQKLSGDLNISMKEASSLIKTYYEKYPKVKEFMDKQRKGLKEDIRVYTLLNRVRYIKQHLSRSRREKSHGDRLSVNSPIQGTSADLIKIAMINIYNEFKKRDIRSKLIIQVHDELVFEVLKEELEEVEALVKKEMENVMELKVPLKVSINTGENWEDAH